MRILSVSTSNVGGLVDGRVDFPLIPVVAVAGSNGTGKSKLLSCLISVWSNIIPPPRNQSIPTVIELTLSLNDGERATLKDASIKAGSGDPGDIPASVNLILEFNTYRGLDRRADPSITILTNIWTNAQLMSLTPGLNLVYLPAERRLLPSGQAGIDLESLSETVAWNRSAEARNSVNNYGRLDDQEFENFAKALCIQSKLEDDGTETPANKTRIEWPEFKRTVDSLIAPKELLPITKQNPRELRIRTPSGETHPVPQLSSGERQALIIISRVLQAGSSHTTIIIDEPDAYLHPTLSQRLMLALQRGIGQDGQLIVATHSPAILDSLPANSILRMSFGSTAQLVSNEADRISLYREAGFRASALSQSDLLVVTEGSTDFELLTTIFPKLARASVQPAGGRKEVIHRVTTLLPADLPVIGVIDRDVLNLPIPDAVRSLITPWPTADIEGAFLSDDQFLEAMIKRKLTLPSYTTVASLKAVLDVLLENRKQNTIAELAQQDLRERMTISWPSPKTNDAIANLRNAVSSASPLDAAEVDTILVKHEQTWLDTDYRWEIVRGKYIIDAFAKQVSTVKTGHDLLRTLASDCIGLDAFAAFRAEIDRRLQ